MERKKIKSSRYLSAFAITIVIFLLGFIVSSLVNEARLQKVYDLENDIRVQSLGNELVYKLISTDLCDNINLSSYTLELTKLGKKLTYMESVYGYDSPQVKNLKEYYSLLLVRHWIINQQASEECNISKSNVLFFYTNVGDCEDCNSQGMVLTNIHAKYPIFDTYSFEFTEETPTIMFLREKYDLNLYRLPTLVINDKVFYGFQSKDFLVEYLQLETEEMKEKIEEMEKENTSINETIINNSSNETSNATNI